MVRYLLDARTATNHFPGIGRYVFNLAQAMIPLLDQTEELILLYNPTQSSPWLLTKLVEAQVKLVAVPLSPFSLRQQWMLPRLAHQFEANLYHSPYYLMPYLMSMPTLVTVHDLIPIIYPRYFTFSQRLIFKLTIRLATAKVSQVIAVSGSTAHDLYHYLHLPQSQVTVIPEAADPIFSPAPMEIVAALRQRLHLPDGYVLYLGSNKPHKNLVRLVEAWAQIQPQPLPLVIAGVWDTRYPQARHRSETLGIDQVVRFLGPLDEADLPALYRGATLFVFPSEYEGFGLPVLEAMACGVPVACSNSASLSEVAGDAALKFDPHNIEEIKAGLKQLIECPKMQAQLSQQGHQQAARFSWQRTALQTLELYRKYHKPRHLSK